MKTLKLKDKRFSQPHTELSQVGLSLSLEVTIAINYRSSTGYTDYVGHLLQKHAIGQIPGVTNTASLPAKIPLTKLQALSLTN